MSSRLHCDCRWAATSSNTSGEWRREGHYEYISNLSKKNPKKLSRRLIFWGSLTLAISHKSVSLSGSGPLGWGRGGEALFDPPPTFLSPCSVFETGAVAGGTAVALLSVTANGEKELPGNMAAVPGRANVFTVPFILLEWAHVRSQTRTPGAKWRRSSRDSVFYRLVSLLSRSNHRLVDGSVGKLIGQELKNNPPVHVLTFVAVFI